jgi:hypothetical protein
MNANAAKQAIAVMIYRTRSRPVSSSGSSFMTPP